MALNLDRTAQSNDKMLLTELSSLEIELHHPGVICTPERLEEILHADFFEVGRSGNQYNRATVIRFLLSQHQPPSVESCNFAVHELGQDQTLLTYRSANRQPNGTLINPTLRSSIWLRNGSGWQLRYHQGTPTAEVVWDAPEV